MNLVPQHKPARPGGRAGETRHADYNRSRRDPVLLDIYSGMPWKKFRAYIKRERVLCEWCKAKGLIVLGEHVHHEIDPRDRPDLTFDEGNVKLVCKPCHSAHHAKRKAQ